MARSRNIKPGFFANELLIDLPFEHRLLFIGLWTIADRDGRLEDRPKQIKIKLFPGDNLDVEAGLAALAKSGFILRYSAGGTPAIQVRNWRKHQQPHFKEKASSIQAPDKPEAFTPTAPKESPGLEPDKPQIGPEPAALIPDSGFLIPDSKKKPPDGGTDDPKALIWKTGVSLLRGGGASEDAARRFLGQFAKSETKLAEVIGYLAANPKVEPRAYIVAAMTRKTGAEQFAEEAHAGS